jgi:hypothetical protein
LRIYFIYTLVESHAFEGEVATWLEELTYDAVWLGEVAFEEEHSATVFALLVSECCASNSSAHYNDVPYLKEGLVVGKKVREWLERAEGRLPAHKRSWNQMPS